MATTLPLPTLPDAAAPGSAVVVLDRLTRRFGRVTAVDDVSCAIPPGTVTAILGPNGAGKTTTVQMILGLLEPSSGTVRVCGRDPRERVVRERVGAMLQVGHVPPTLTVREHLTLFSSYYPTPLALDDLLDSADLVGVARRRFGELSQGLQRRVLCALAMVGDPDILVLDEPTVGMDVESRRAMWAMIRGLLTRGRSVLLTTHYLEEADVLADRVLVMRRGCIVADDTPAGLRTRAGLSDEARLEDAFVALTSEAEPVTARAEGGRS